MDGMSSTLCRTPQVKTWLFLILELREGQSYESYAWSPSPAFGDETITRR